MFIKLRKRLFNSIFWVLFAFVVITSGVSCATITGFLFSSQQQRCQNNVHSGVIRCDSYVENAMSLAANAANNKDIVEFLKGGTADVSGKLNDFYNYSIATDGVILYSVSGHVSCSSGVGSAPTYAELLSVPQINEFVQSQQNQLVSVRKQAVAKAYGSIFYNAENGVISCLHKVTDENGEMIGLLEVDILPKTLADVKLKYNSFSAQCSSFFIVGNELLTDNEEFVRLSDFSDGVTKNLKYYAVYGEVFDGCRIVMFAPLSEFVRQAVVLAFVFFALDAVLTCAVALIAFNVRDSVVDPLENLLKKMNAEGVK